MPWKGVTVSAERRRFLEDYQLSYYSITELAKRFGIPVPLLAGGPDAGIASSFAFASDPGLVRIQDLETRLNFVRPARRRPRGRGSGVGRILR